MKKDWIAIKCRWETFKTKRSKGKFPVGKNQIGFLTIIERERMLDTLFKFLEENG